MKTARLSLIAVSFSIALSLCSRPASAQLFEIDQSATPPSTDTGVLFSGNTIGQGFRPTLPAVDFIDVGMISMNPTDSGTFQLRLHHRDLGSIIAVSDTVTLSTGSPGLVHFTFPTSVSLTPGDTYLFDIPHNGPTWGAIIGPTPYDRGSATVVDTLGWPADHDLWFQEGVVVPEPAPWQLATAALVLFGFARRRSKFPA